MIAGSILLSRALAPVEQAIGAWKGAGRARAPATIGYGSCSIAIPDGTPAIRLPAPEGRVSVDRLAFKAPDSDRLILKSVAFELAPGEVLAVVGPSGSGKSTLCRLITGVWPPTSGHVRLDGAEVHAWDRADFGRSRRLSAPGCGAVRGQRARQHRPHGRGARRGGDRGRPPRRRSRDDPAAAGRLRHRDRAAGRHALRRPAAVDRPRPCDVRRAAAGRPRRAERQPGPGRRGGAGRRDRPAQGAGARP